MKRLIVCLDGTWQTLEQTNITNIAIIARSITHAEQRPGQDTIQQIVIYSQGVGATTDALARTSLMGKASRDLTRLAGGAFGEGLEDMLLDTYVRLAFNYEPGDEIYVFGFSRGAFIARSLVGLIDAVGIVSRRFVDLAWEGFRIYRARPREGAAQEEFEAHAREAREFRRQYGKGRRDAQGARIQSDDAPPITYMGIFDTVGQRGAPGVSWLSKLVNRRYGFHNLKPCANVMAARHAVAIDECRLGFPPTLWTDLDEANARVGRKAFEQRWFVGMHGDVGGGVGSPLSATPLRWVVEGAQAMGLKLYDTEESPYLQAMKQAGLSFDSAIKRPGLLKSLSPMNIPLRTRRIWSKRQAPSEADAEDNFHPSVAYRVALQNLRPRYRPPPIRPFRKALQ
ncbi:MAG: DUF2235 domain-containing protein, partial [Terricaulis sp.]